MPVQGFGPDPELHDEVAREIFWLGFPALLPPEPQEGGLIITHDDPSIGPTNKRSPACQIRWVAHSKLLNGFDVINIIRCKEDPLSRKISSAQMRAARALLRWSALDLANASKVGVATIRRAEVVDGEVSVTRANDAAIRLAFETAGIIFIDNNGGGEGVRFRISQVLAKQTKS